MGVFCVSIFSEANCYAMACQGFGTFGALAVRGPGGPDRGVMDEKEKEKEEWADLRLTYNNHHYERWVTNKHKHQV